MNSNNEEALRIVLIMYRDLHFAVDINSILKNPVLKSTDVHIRLESTSKDFYQDYFANVCMQMQLLTALGDTVGAELVLNNIKSDICLVVTKATNTKIKVVFSIPTLEDCLILKPLE